MYERGVEGLGGGVILKKILRLFCSLKILVVVYNILAKEKKRQGMYRKVPSLVCK